MYKYPNLTGYVIAALLYILSFAWCGLMFYIMNTVDSIGFNIPTVMIIIVGAVLFLNATVIFKIIYNEHQAAIRRNNEEKRVKAVLSTNRSSYLTSKW